MKSAHATQVVAQHARITSMREWRSGLRVVCEARSTMKSAHATQVVTRHARITSMRVEFWLKSRVRGIVCISLAWPCR